MTSDEGQKAEMAYGHGSKQRIFRATLSVALRKGFGKVTLSLVACEAGLSKSGLLYHVTSKRDLIRATLQHYSGPWFQPAGALGVRGSMGDQPCDVDPLTVATLVAAAEDPELLEPLREMLQSCETAVNHDPKTMLSPSPLVGDLANRLDLRKKEGNPAAYVVRHKENINLLGLFVAQNIDELWDAVDEFCDPTEYEYRPVERGALVLSKNEMGIGASSDANPSRPVEYGLKMSGSLMDAAVGEDSWTAFDAADEGSSVIARTLEQLERMKSLLPGSVDSSSKETDE